MATKKKTEPIKRFTKSRWINQPIKAHEDTGEILTKPNQSMTIREILFRNTQGMTYVNFKTPYYEDQATFSSQSLNKIQEMEPTEKLQYLNEVNSQVTELQEKIKNHEAQKLAEAQKIIDSANTSETTEE